MDAEPKPAGSSASPKLDLFNRLHGAAGLCSLVFCGLLIGSGIGLAMAYVPSQTEAFPSILYLRQQGGLGAVLRSLHYQLSSGAVVATFLMVIFGILSQYHRERKWEFRLGVVALLLMIGFCFTGYVLPMDQPAYWGTSVRLGIVETVPVVGGMQADMLRGGSSFGSATLPRFFALHVAALPLILVIFVLVGFRDALDRAARGHGFKLIVACGLIAAVAWIMALLLQAPLEPRADAADTEYVPRPEWYFLWLFQFGKYVHGFQWVESGLLPAIGIGTLMLLPEIRTSFKHRLAGVASLFLVMFGLSALALYDDRDLPKKPQYEEGLILKSARDYKVECSGCHGINGKGDGPDTGKLDAKAKNFTRADYWDENTMTDMVEIITNGVAPDMPAFGSRLSAEQILALTNHIETNFKPRAPPKH
ncbi:MAG: cytochrome b N-terminal domain-containing protein [Vicinamibacteria bacterium]